MSIHSFFILYHRKQGLLQLLSFHDRHDLAARHRDAAEAAYRDDPDMEPIVLISDSVASIIGTHSRYFGLAGQTPPRAPSPGDDGGTNTNPKENT